MSLERMFKEEDDEHRVSRMLLSVRAIRESFEQEIGELNIEVQDLKNHLEGRRKYFEELLNIRLIKPTDYLKKSDNFDAPIAETENPVPALQMLDESESGAKRFAKEPMTPESPVLISKIRGLSNDSDGLHRCPKSPVLFSAAKPRPFQSHTVTICSPDTPELASNLNGHTVSGVWQNGNNVITPQSPELVRKLPAPDSDSTVASQGCPKSPVLESAMKARQKVNSTSNATGLTKQDYTGFINSPHTPELASNLKGRQVTALSVLVAQARFDTPTSPVLSGIRKEELTANVHNNYIDKVHKRLF